MYPVRSRRKTCLRHHNQTKAITRIISFTISSPKRSENLVVDSDANIPGITFNYTIRRGTPQDATATTIEILESPLGGGSIGTAVFSNADTENTIDGLPTDANPSNPTAGKKYVQKSVSITFPVGTFTKPGVYRFVINETNNNLPGVTYDSNPTRYLDVFVVADDNNVLSVNSYVLRDAATDIGTNGEYVVNPTVKSSGYTNSLTQYNFDFSKTISGNQGDKNKRFSFTLTITGANPGTYPIIAHDVEGNPTSITVGANGTATGEKHYICPQKYKLYSSDHLTDPVPYLPVRYDRRL